MRRSRPHVSMGPEGIRKGGLGSAVRVHDLAGYLEWYERIASELAAGRRQLVVDGETVPAEQAVSFAHRLLALAEQARCFPAQVREGWESRNDRVSDRRERKRILAQVPDVIVEFVSEAYVAGIEMGFRGARLAAEELRPLVEQGEAKERANVAGGRGKSLARLAPQWQKVIDREYAEAQERGRKFKLSAARRKARSEVPKEREPDRLACPNTIAKWTRDPRDRDRSHMPGI